MELGGILDPRLLLLWIFRAFYLVGELWRLVILVRGCGSWFLQRCVERSGWRGITGFLMGTQNQLGGFTREPMSLILLA